MIATDDLSFKAVASQYPITPDPHHQYVASNALDRNTTTCMRTNDIGTNAPYNTTWWKVDLGEVYSIFSINIMFKTYESYGMYLFCLNFYLAASKYNTLDFF